MRSKKSAENETEKISTINFIDAVRNHIELWDIRSDGYKLKEKKQVIWNELAKEFNLEDGEEASKKWKYLRDYYSRSQKKPPSGSAAKRGKPWPYIEAMSFYQPIIEPNPNRCDSTGATHSEDEEVAEDSPVGSPVSVIWNSKENVEGTPKPRTSFKRKRELTETELFSSKLTEVAEKISKSIDVPSKNFVKKSKI